jgi:hypothetical protein
VVGATKKGERHVGSFALIAKIIMLKKTLLQSVRSNNKNTLF